MKLPVLYHFKTVVLIIIIAIVPLLQQYLELSVECETLLTTPTSPVSWVKFCSLVHGGINCIFPLHGECRSVVFVLLGKGSER